MTNIARSPRAVAILTEFAHHIGVAPAEVLATDHDRSIIPNELLHGGTVPFRALGLYGTLAAHGAQFEPTPIARMALTGRPGPKGSQPFTAAVRELVDAGWLLVADPARENQNGGAIYQAMMWPIAGSDDPRVLQFAEEVAAAGGQYPSRSVQRSRQQALRDAVAARRLAILQELIDTDGARCFYCQHSPSDWRDLEVEHRQPVSRGGTNARANLVPACDGCNSLKRDMTEAEFYAFLETALFEGGI